MTTLPSHTDSAFDEDLGRLNTLLREMSGLALAMVADCAALLAAPDPDKVDRLVATDDRLDALRSAIEEKAVITIARRQPVANDLRAIVATMRIAGALERVGDMAKNTARRSLKLDGTGTPTEGLQAARRMLLQAHRALERAMAAFEAGDPEAAEAVWRSDVDLDGMLSSLFRELLTYMAENPRAITPCTHLLFVAKNAERIGDHATTVAEAAHYVVNGMAFEGERPKIDSAAMGD